MKKILQQLSGHQALSPDEAYDVFGALSRGLFSDAETAAFLMVYAMRSISSAELAGFSAALLDLSFRPNLPASDAVDLCGTGGDGKQTFNISTLASFVVAAAGGKVIKHGNYGVSSLSGSSNVLEYFGCIFTSDEDKLNRQLESCGICFLHAPLFHPALRNVAAVRRNLGMRTLFNMLGPLVNPAQPAYRVNGVFSASLGRLYQYLAQERGQEIMSVFSLDGYDELSLTSEAKIFRTRGEYMFSPEENGFKRCSPEDLFAGKSREEAEQLFYRILSGKGTPQQEDVVIANAALAIQCSRQEKNYSDAVYRAGEALRSGAAENCFKRFIELN